MKKNIHIIIPIIYIVGVLLTYGYKCKVNLQEQILKYGDTSLTVTLSRGDALWQGLAWPIYWPFHLSRLAFE